MLSPAEAADIARRHGLDLSAAAGLLSLADSAEEAETIAGKFAEPSSEAAMRELTRRIFDRSEDDANTVALLDLTETPRGDQP